MIITIQYKEHGEFIDMLDGVFTFVLLDTHDSTFLAAGVKLRFPNEKTLVVGCVPI
jgi:hypothetical protein